MPNTLHACLSRSSKHLCVDFSISSRVTSHKSRVTINSGISVVVNGDSLGDFFVEILFVLLVVVSVITSVVGCFGLLVMFSSFSCNFSIVLPTMLWMGVSSFVSGVCVLLVVVSC